MDQSPNFWTAFYWIGIGIGGILTVLGAKKLLELMLTDWLARRKQRAEINITNDGKAIDADINAFNSIYKRLESVESRLDAVQSELSDQKVENAKLEAENSRLSKDNDRQEQEIIRQRSRLHQLANDLQGKNAEILELKNTLIRREREQNVLKSELHTTIQALNALSREVRGLHDSQG